MELTIAELVAETALELPQRALMHHHRHHGNSFSQSNNNSIHNHSQQAASVSGDHNDVDQHQTTVNLIFSNTAGTQQN
jgi:hypothetical protein